MISVKFTNELENITSSSHLYQWDVGQILKIEGLNVGSPKVHFASKGFDVAFVVQSEINDGAIICAIPDKVLQTGRPIIAYVYVETEVSGATIKSVTIPVVARTKPNGYVETNPQDVIETQAFLEAINERLTKVEDELKNLELDAKNVEYTDTHNLGAVNVQDAIDKVFQYGNNVKAGLVDSLEFSGLGLTDENTFEDIFNALESKFPASFEDLTSEWTVDGEYPAIKEKSSVVRDGNTIKFKCTDHALGGDAWCETSTIPSNTYSKMKIIGTATCGDQIEQSGATLIISSNGATIQEYEIPYDETIEFEVETDASNSLRITTIANYKTTSVDFRIVLYNGDGNIDVDGGGVNTKAISDMLNKYTGETKLMNEDEIASKIDELLSALTNNGTRALYLYAYCDDIKTIPQMNYGDAKSFTSFCFHCEALEEVPPIDTSRSTDFTNAFNYDSNLVTIGLLDFSSVTRASNTNGCFARCYELQNITFAGIINVNVSFADCSKLTNASVQSIIDHLADLTGKTAQTLTLHADVKARMTDGQKAQITSKNWTLA